MELKKGIYQARLLGLFLFTVFFLAGGFWLLQKLQPVKLVMTIFAVIWGVGSVGLLYYVLNSLAQSLPRKARRIAVAAVFAGPAIIILAWALVFPTLRTIWLSFFNASSTEFVGLSITYLLFPTR